MKSEIFKEYRRRYPDCDVNDDGIVNKIVFDKEALKCLSFLKERNSLDCGPCHKFCVNGRG